MVSPKASKPKVLLIGWDAADWKIITPLLDAGELPHLEKFINAGTMGNLASIEPPLSPLVWNTIATGLLPDQHGVQGFSQVDTITGKVRPFGTIDRKAKAIWNILSQNGFRTNVVNWFASHPAEPINGVYVSELYTHSITSALSYEALSEVPPHSVHPENLAKTLAEFRVAVDEIDPDQIALFVKRFREIDQSKDPQLLILAKMLAECFTIHAATTWVMENRDWDFLATLYGTIDHFCHSFMKFHPPRQSHVSAVEFELYRDVINSVYRLHDVLLGRLMHLAGDEATVILCSDHGYHTDHLRPRMTQQTAAGPAAEHRPIGILAMKGPGIKSDELIHGASVVDITPTILHLFGLPIGEDMVGRPLLDAFRNAEPTKTVPTWEGSHPNAGMVEQRSQIDSTDYDALLKQFVALGYMPQHSGDDAEYAASTTVENKWNLARVHVGSGQLLMALPLLEEIYEEAPLRLEFALALSECQFKLGLKDEATEVMNSLIRVFPNQPLATMYRGMLAFEQGNVAEASALLRGLEASPPGYPVFFNYLGYCYLRINEPEKALEAFKRSIELNPESPAGYVGEAQAFLRLKQYEDAIESSLHALSVNFSSATAHFYLGMALAPNGDLVRSVQAFETCLKLNPGFTAAQRCLLRIYPRVETDGTKAGDLQKSYSAKTPQRLSWEIRMEKLRGEAGARAAVRQERRKARNLALAQLVSAAPPISSLASNQKKTFVIVSGLPRSGTSLMMQMLQAGGIPAMTDDRRVADIDNPLGYLEWEEIKTIGEQPEIILRAEGKATKVISMLLPNLPKGHHYKVLFMDRPVTEIAASQAKMLGRNSRVEAKDAVQLLPALRKHRDDVLQMLEKAPDVEFCTVQFGNLIEMSDEELRKIAAFLGPSLPHPERMIDAISPELHRNKGESGVRTKDAIQPDQVKEFEPEVKESGAGAFQVRFALPQDLPRFARSFPMALQYPTESRLFVLENEVREVIGGGYLLFTPALRPTAEVLFDILIFPDHDFEPAATTLLHFFIKLCRSRRRLVLAPTRPTLAGSPLEKLLLAHGFVAGKDLTGYVVNTDRLLEHFDATYARLVQKGRVPPAMEIVSLASAPHMPVRELILGTIGGDPIRLDRELGDRRFDEEVSLLVRLGTTIIGVILVRFEKGVPEIAYLAIERGKRNTWAYAALCTHFLRLLKKRGCPEVILRTNNAAVMHSAERVEHRVVGRAIFYRLSL